MRLSASATDRRTSSTSSLSESRSHDHSSSQSAVSTDSSAPEQEQRIERAESIYVEQGTETSSTVQHSDLGVSNVQTVEEVEVAEEATSEIAFQTLHQTSSEIANRHDSSSHENSPTPQEIPLEDMSRKMKSKRKEQLTRAKLTKSRLAAELKMQQEQSRSTSQSPKRKPSSESISKIKLRGRSTSLTTESQDSRSRSGTPERRVHSESSPLPYSSSSQHSYRLKKKSKEMQTQTMLSVELASARVNSSNELKSDSPKTLRPAPSPAVSLVPEIDPSFDTTIKDSPKLMPPVDKDRSYSDVSQTSSDNDISSQSSNRGSDSMNLPNLGLDTPIGAGAELSTASVKVETLKPPSVTEGKTASDRLTQLAQIVQQYNFNGDQEETSDDKQT